MVVLIQVLGQRRGKASDVAVLRSSMGYGTDVLGGMHASMCVCIREDKELPLSSVNAAGL